jgi:hypothetical protein
MPEAFWSFKLADILNAIILLVTIWAIIYGPAHAVEITRRQDSIRDAITRKRRILSTLMRTRRVVMDPGHVGALNEIQLEFSDDSNVISAFKAYISNLSDTVPAPGNALDNFMKRRSDLFFDLLHAISKAADVIIDRHELDRLAYVPLGWQTEQQEQQAVRASLIEVLQGRKALHIVPTAPTAAPAPQYNNPFPPPPT